MQRLVKGIGMAEATYSERTYKARFTTAGRLDTIESWLRENAKSNWTFKFMGASDDMTKKNYVIVFDDKADCDLFRFRFTPAKPANRNGAAVPALTSEPPSAPEPAKTENIVAAPEAEPEAPVVQSDMGQFLKSTAGNFVSALAQAFASKPAPVEEEDQSSLPASFRSSTKSSSTSSSAGSSLPASFKSSSS